MTSRVPGSLSSERVSRFKKGVGEYLTVNGVQRLLEAIDAETLLDEALAEEVPAEEGARIAGRVVGRVVAKEATGYLPLGSIVEAAVGRTVGEGAVALVIEYGSVAAIVARVSSASERVDFDTRTRRIADFDVRGRTNGVCDLLRPSERSGRSDSGRNGDRLGGRKRNDGPGRRGDRKRLRPTRAPESGHRRESNRTRLDGLH